MKSSILQLPFGFGRLALSYEREGCARRVGGLVFATNLRARRYDWRGRLTGQRDLGSGLVTNVGVLALAAEFGIAGVSAAPINLFALMKQHSSGTGVVAAATTDIKLGTPITTNSAPVVAGTQVLVSAANLQKYQSVATILYDTGGPFAVTEWGLFTGATLSAATGSPFTAGDATHGTVTATPLTASSTTVQGQQQTVFENTGNATPSWGLVQSNTTSIVTVPAWYKVSDGTLGANPANTNTYVIRPVLWDRKQFAAINVANGDSVQFTYTLQITAGG